MAKNSGAIEQALPVNVELTVGANKSAGDVLALNDLVVYLQTDSDANNKAICTIPCRFVERVAVHAANNTVDNAIAVGDKLYYDSTEINKDSTDGKACGYALDAVDAGATTTIRVGFGL